MWLKCSLFNKNCFFFFTSGYFLRAPDNSIRFPLKVRGLDIFMPSLSQRLMSFENYSPCRQHKGVSVYQTEAPHYYSSFLYAQHVHATGWANFGRPETTTAVAKDNSGEYEKRGCWCISTTGLAMVDNAGKRQGCKLVAQHSTPWGAGADIE